MKKTLNYKLLFFLFFFFFGLVKLKFLFQLYYYQKASSRYILSKFGSKKFYLFCYLKKFFKKFNKNNFQIYFFSNLFYKNICMFILQFQNKNILYF